MFSPLLKNHDHGWKWCVVLASSELDPAPEKLYFPIEAIVVKPRGICSCREKKNDFRAWKSGINPSFSYPLANLTTVGRIAEHCFAGPVSIQTIFLFCIVLLALGILMSRSRIKRKMVNVIKCLEQFRRCFPFRGAALQHCIPVHALFAFFSVTRKTRLSLVYLVKSISG